MLTSQCAFVACCGCIRSVNNKCKFNRKYLNVNYIHAGIRVHFTQFIKGLTETSAAKAQLGLGHSYSRDKVKFNVNRVDNMIIQSVSLLDQLDKDINTFSMRIRYFLASCLIRGDAK